MTDTALPRDVPRERRNVAVLVLAQALLGSQMAMIFIVGGLAGQSLASNVVLCHAAHFAHRAGLDAVGHAAELGDAAMGAPRRIPDRGGRGGPGAAIAAWGLWTASFPVYPAGQPADRHLHVGAGVLPLRRRRHRQRRVPAQGDFLCHGRRAGERGRRAAVGEGDDAGDGDPVRGHLSGRDRAQPLRRGAVSLPRHPETAAAGRGRARGAAGGSC